MKVVEEGSSRDRSGFLGVRGTSVFKIFITAFFLAHVAQTLP